MSVVASALTRANEVRGALRRPHEERTLGQRMAISSMLSTAEFGLSGVTRLISTIILTRLLAPEDFGVYAVVLFVLYLLTMVTDLGIRSIVLTHDGAVDAAFLRTCWTIQAIRGTVISAAVVLIGLGLAGLQSAGLAGEASSYADPALPWVICASSAVLMMQSLQSPAQFTYERDMRFLRVSLLRMIMIVLGAALTIMLVLMMGNIWALLIGQSVATGLQTMLTFLLFRGPSMGFQLDPASMRAVMARGTWIIGHSAMTAATELADRILLSLFLTADAFGLYYLARQIATLFIDYARSLDAQFALQFFTDLQSRDEPAAVSAGYYRYRLAVDVALGVLSGSLFALAPTIIEILYDDRYASAGDMLRLLALGLPLVGVGFIRDAFSAQRRFKEMAFLSAVQTVSIWVGLIISLFVFNSATAALLVVALHRLPELALMLAWARSEGWVRLRREALVAPLFVTGLGLGWGLDHLWAMVVRSL